MTSREALLLKAREWRLANWRHHVPSGVADGSSDCGFFYPEETDSLLADFYLSELAAPQKIYEDMADFRFRGLTAQELTASLMELQALRGGNPAVPTSAVEAMARQLAAKELEIEKLRKAAQAVIHAEEQQTGSRVCRLLRNALNELEAALQREGPEGGKP